MTYLPRHPEIHCLGPAKQRLESHNRVANLLALALAVAFPILFVGMEFKLSRELHLARVGELAEGQITEKGSNKGRYRTSCWVRYRFDAPDGQRSGQTTVGEYLWGYLDSGTAITVLYDPDHPSRHRPSFGLGFVHFLPNPEEQ